MHQCAVCIVHMRKIQLAQRPIMFYLFQNRLCFRFLFVFFTRCILQYKRFLAPPQPLPPLLSLLSSNAYFPQFRFYLYITTWPNFDRLANYHSCSLLLWMVQPYRVIIGTDDLVHFLWHRRMISEHYLRYPIFPHQCNGCYLQTGHRYVCVCVCVSVCVCCVSVKPQCGVLVAWKKNYCRVQMTKSEKMQK